MAATWLRRKRRTRTRRHHGLARRNVARCSRREHRRAGGRLLRSRRRVAVGGAIGGRTAQPLSRDDGRTSVRPPSVGIAGRFPRRHRQAEPGTGRRHAPHCRADTVVHPGGPGTADRSAGHADRPSVGDLAGAGQQRCGAAAPAALAGNGQLVAGCGGLRRIHHPAGPHGHCRIGGQGSVRRPEAGHLPSWRI